MKLNRRNARTAQRVLALAYAAGTFFAAAPPPRGAAAGTLALKPCTVGKTKLAASCGTFTVYEDPALRKGTTIAGNVIVIKAKHPSHRAIAEIAGGPGEASTDLAQPLADGAFNKYVQSLRATYDIVFFDARGMGKYGFGCHFANAHDAQRYMRWLFPTQTLHECAEKNAWRNRALYNTNNATDDLNELREKLGYSKIVLDGGSYGTFFSLVFMRRHPQAVRAAILDGVAPPGFQPLPGAPDGAQHALNDAIASCEAQAVCHERYPHFAQEFTAVIRRFDRAPINVRFQNPATKKTESAALSKEVLVDRLRNLMYDPQGVALLPLIVHRAYLGDYRPLATAVAFVSLDLGTTLDLGAMMSYTCEEFIPFLNAAQVRDAAAHSFAGDLRIRAQQRACTTWNVPAMPAAFNDPVVSDIPALLITGSDDPATPPGSAARALPYLHNARQVYIRGGGHGNESPCTDALVVAFVQRASAKGLDVGHCSVPRKRMPFYTSVPEWLK